MVYLDILILLFVVLFIFSRLKNVLGTGGDATTKQIKLDDHQAEKLLELIQDNLKEKIVNASEADKTLATLDNFDKRQFIENTKKVFEIVINAYAKNDIDGLKKLLSNNLFKKFSEAIENNKNNAQKTFAELISFKKADIIDVKINKTTAKIQVCFETEQLNITKDKDDKVIAGDENYIQTINDVWTFEKSLSSKSPIWLLASTKKQ